MTPAEKRIKDLIDRWLNSVELHLQYVELSDEAYAEIQNWPKHDRPTRWVLELAKQKANELREAIEARHQMGDSKFADSLELMSFLANLVGAQHVDRFVPMAEPQPESEIPKPAPRPAVRAPAASDVPSWYTQAHTAPAPANKPPPPKAPAASMLPSRPVAGSVAPVSPAASVAPAPKVAARGADPDATREMPKVRPQAPTTQSPAKSEPKKSAAPKSSAAEAAPAKPASKSAPQNDVHSTLIADAVRLMGWGRTWHELAELIARMADRPPLAEVRKILRAHRATIEKAAKEAKK